MDKKGVKATSSNFNGLGWLLIISIAVTFFICGLGGSVQNITAGIFEGMFGWDQAFVISLNSIGGWIGVLFIFLFGILMTKGKMNRRGTILSSAVIVGVCYIFMGRTGSLPLYSVLFCVYIVFYQIWAQLANSTLCSNWFPQKRCRDRLGGIKINYKLEVLTQDWQKIPGLYAAGTDVNDIYAGTYLYLLAGNTMGLH